MRHHTRQNLRTAGQTESKRKPSQPDLNSGPQPSSKDPQSGTGRAPLPHATSERASRDASRYRKLEQRIRDGAGQGHLDDYVPMWRITRANITRFGSQMTGPLPGYRRGSHFRARSHLEMALLALWIGALDVRENYPLWLFDHPHPLTGWPDDRVERRPCRGLLELFDGKRRASNLIRQALGGSIPDVTLMVTFGDPTHPRCMLVECLGAEAFDGTKLPLLDYSERYASANDIRYMASVPEHVGHTFMANLVACSYAVNAVRRDMSPSLLAASEASLRRDLEHNTFLGAVAATSIRLKVDERNLWTVVHYMKWRQTIDVDLRQPVYHSERPIPGGQALRSALQKIIFGQTP